MAPTGRSKRQYTDEDKAAVFTQLTVNKGNVLRTSRETGVPQQTVRDWKKEWETRGVPAPVEEIAEEIAGEFVETALRVRDKALAQIELLIPDTRASDIQKLATIVGILEDKRRMAEGLATKRTEVTHTLPSPEEMRDLMSGFVSGAVEAARERDAVIIDAEVVEQPLLGLPAEVSTQGDVL